MSRVEGKSWLFRQSNVRCRVVRVDQPTVNESLSFFTLNVTWLSVCIGAMAENENDMMRKWPFSLVLFMWRPESGAVPGRDLKKKNLIFVHRKGNRNGPIWESVVEFDICYSSWRPGFFFFFQLAGVRRRRRYLVIICHGTDSKRRRRFLTSEFFTGQSVAQQLASVPHSRIVRKISLFLAGLFKLKSELDPICESYPAAQ